MLTSILRVAAAAAKQSSVNLETEGAEDQIEELMAALESASEQAKKAKDLPKQFEDDAKTAVKEVLKTATEFGKILDTLAEENKRFAPYSKTLDVVVKNLKAWDVDVMEFATFHANPVDEFYSLVQEVQKKDRKQTPEILTFIRGPMVELGAKTRFRYKVEPLVQTVVHDLYDTLKYDAMMSNLQGQTSFYGYKKGPPADYSKLVSDYSDLYEQVMSTVSYPHLMTSAWEAKTTFVIDSVKEMTSLAKKISKRYEEATYAKQDREDRNDVSMGGYML
jgi:hypothetical protein